MPHTKAQRHEEEGHGSWRKLAVWLSMHVILVLCAAMLAACEKSALETMPRSSSGNLELVVDHSEAFGCDVLLHYDGRWRKLDLASPHSPSESPFARSRFDVRPGEYSLLVRPFHGGLNFESTIQINGPLYLYLGRYAGEMGPAIDLKMTTSPLKVL